MPLPSVCLPLNVFVFLFLNLTHLSGKPTIVCISKGESARGASQSLETGSIKLNT